MINYSIFVVDDEPSSRNGITLALQSNYTAQGFGTAEDFLDTFRKEAPDLVLLDIGLPGMSGIDALKKVKEINPEVIVIMITAFEDLNTVISAMKLGAYDYIVKPIHMEALLVSIENALETIRLRKEVRFLQEKNLSENIPCFIGESKSIQNIMGFVDRVAQSPDTPVLVCGETGTGKELIASAIHFKSPNFKGPLVTLNCAAIPKDLIESELFGYEKGAFSGAHQTGKKGMVEKSANGTLFLDEVGDLGLEAQAKLLRFLEDGEYYRVGGTEKHHVKTRVVSATNRNLEDMIENDLFRQDLFYRLAVIKVEIPKLTKRTDDIIPIANHFLFEFSKKFKKTFTGLSSDAADTLLNHDWQGNIRELKNCMERAALTGNGPLLSTEDIGLLNKMTTETPKGTASNDNQAVIPETGADINSILRETEIKYFKKALLKSKGNESKASRLLNLNYYTFRHRRKKLNI
jgi:two-component system response regulator AtoC